MSNKYDYRKGKKEDFFYYINVKDVCKYWFNDADYVFDSDINAFCNNYRCSKTIRKCSEDEYEI